MADFVRYTLDDGSTVLFESAEADLVSLHGGGDTRDGGRLADRLTQISKSLFWNLGQVAWGAGEAP